MQGCKSQRTLVVCAVLELLASSACAGTFVFVPAIDLFIDSSAGNAKVEGKHLDIGDG